MSSVVFCPHCQGQVANDPRMAGQLVSCPYCQGQFTMPAMMAGPAVAPPPPPVSTFSIVDSSPIVNVGKSRYEYHKRSRSQTETTKLWLGIVGSIVLFVGVFAPIISAPFVGNVNYFQNGKGDGTIVLILAVLSFVLVLTKFSVGLWLTGLGSLSVLVFTFVNFQTKMAEAKAKMDKDLAGNPFRGFADVAIQSAQLEWGWALLVVGAMLVIASAAIPTK